MSRTSNRQRSITLPLGFRAAGATCGIKASGLPDLALIVSDRPCQAAAVFTTNQCQGEPVLIARRHVRRGGLRAIVCNSGNANVATGARGLEDAIAMARQTAQLLDPPPCQPHQVIPASTGIIGHYLPMEKIGRGIAIAASRLQRGPAADAAVARAILTTDLVPKPAHQTLRLGAKTVHLGGIAKGSGMIAPHMATMLAFLTTDAAITPALLRRALQQAAALSFNRISVDQHTSPSDMAILLANGAAGNAPIRRDGPAYRRFLAALVELCRDLAYQIVKDGEGATRVFRVRVSGARHQRDADRIAQAVVNSPLVKAAVHGSDPNWGRITTAAGYSGAAVRPEKMSLRIGPEKGLCVYRRGQPQPLDRPTLKTLVRLMRKKEVIFHLDIGLGRGQTEWLGCDLSKKYVTINADYTT